MTRRYPTLMFVIVRSPSKLFTPYNSQGPCHSRGSLILSKVVTSGVTDNRHGDPWRKLLGPCKKEQDQKSRGQSEAVVLKSDAAGSFSRILKMPSMCRYLDTGRHQWRISR
jgi:hypothetical protein